MNGHENFCKEHITSCNQRFTTHILAKASSCNICSKYWQLIAVCPITIFNISLIIDRFNFWYICSNVLRCLWLQKTDWYFPFIRLSILQIAVIQKICVVIFLSSVRSEKNWLLVLLELVVQLFCYFFINVKIIYC
jgi:hypothetical protein